MGAADSMGPVSILTSASKISLKSKFYRWYFVASFSVAVRKIDAQVYGKLRPSHSRRSLLIYFTASLSLLSHSSTLTPFSLFRVVPARPLFRNPLSRLLSKSSFLRLLRPYTTVSALLPPLLPQIFIPLLPIRG